MNIVEAIGRESPVLVTVLDFELQVWRYPGRLDRGDIGSDDLATREFVGKVAIQLDTVIVGISVSLTWPKFQFHSQYPGLSECLCPGGLNATRRLAQG